jgi:hypothetical protein
VWSDDVTQETGLQAGVGRAEITPPVGIAHGNWGAATHSRSEGIDMPLYATALALRDAASGTTVVMVETDLLLLSFPLAGAVRQAVAGLTGVPEDHVRVSTSHTHSGPTLGTAASTWVEDGAEMIEAYTNALPAKIAGAAWEAVHRLAPARIATGSGSSTIGVNRRVRAPDGRVVVGRNPDGFFDPTVRVLRIDRIGQAGQAGQGGESSGTGDGQDSGQGGGQPLAAVVHYACHPTIMAWENRLITPDYPGMARRTVEQVTGATCLFLQGCAGNAGPRLGFTEGRTGATADYRRAGAILGAEAARVFLELDTGPYDAVFARVLESGAPLGVYRHVPRAETAQPAAVRVVTERVTLPVRRFPSRAEAEAAAREAREALAAVRRRGGTEDEIYEATWRAKRRAQQAGHARLTDGRGDVEIVLQAIGVGPAAFLGAPMEVFGDLGAAVVADSPFGWTAVSGYTNGSAGYLPTAYAFDEGGYEVEMASPFAREAGERFADSAKALLHRLHVA